MGHVSRELQKLLQKVGQKARPCLRVQRVIRVLTDLDGALLALFVGPWFKVVVVRVEGCAGILTGSRSPGSWRQGLTESRRISDFHDWQGHVTTMPGSLQFKQDDPSGGQFLEGVLGREPAQ